MFLPSPKRITWYKVGAVHKKIGLVTTKECQQLIVNGLDQDINRGSLRSREVINILGETSSGDGLWFPPGNGR